ncbi:hypothetical protein EDC96DRAFT_478734 [Choanephora cucurbitarum]|nr:hypothetical protein EDC96DRAFT_478734 [Choanephora cucurbitarum]
MHSYPSRPHLAVCLPEIVSHIFSFLIPNQNEEPKKRMYTDIYACLTVNHLWHDCASRLVWRKALFEDIRDDMDDFMKFASVISNASMPTLSPSTSTTADALAVGGVTPNTHMPLLLLQPSCSSSSLDTVNTPSDDSLTREKSSSVSPEALYHQIEQLSRTQQQTENRLALYRKFLRILSVRKMKEKSVNYPLSLIGKMATRLEHLDIYICDHFANETLYPFLDHHSLTYLSLAGCHHISDEAILKVAETCKQLEHLDLRACGLVSDLSLSAIALNCPWLRHLNVGRIRDREKVTIKSIELIAKYTQAAVLGLAGCDMDDACMIALAKYRGTGLERVSVNSCFKISNETVYTYIRHCPNLSVFEMKECHHINDWEAVAELVQRKVLLTLCDQQNRAFSEWARIRGRILDVKAPLK